MRDLLDALLPRTCINCTSKLLSYEESICTTCFEGLEFYNESLDITAKPETIFQERLEVESANALLSYRPKSITASLLKELKYFGKKEVAYFLGRELAKAYGDQFTKETLVTYVPLHSKKKRKRGYNQAGLIAKSFAEHAGLKVVSILKRTTNSDSQTTKSRYDRTDSMAKTFELANNLLENKELLLIDDVLTTGATTISCGQILHDKGHKVHVLTAAIAVN